ncbi:MAG: hypothetical protein WDW36_010033 [Sanguina aurantia]
MSCCCFDARLTPDHWLPPDNVQIHPAPAIAHRTRRNTAWPWIQAKLHLDPKMFKSDELMADIKAHIGTIGSMATAVLGTVSRSGLGIVLWLTNLVLIPVVAFYLLRDWDRMVATIDGMLPRSIEPTIAYLARESDKVLGAFVRGQLLVMLALGVFYGGALSLVGLSVGLLIGIVAGLLSFVPYLGFIVGFGGAVIAPGGSRRQEVTHQASIVCGVFVVGTWHGDAEGWIDCAAMLRRQDRCSTKQRLR